jgi:cobalt-zinc-cadmium efflux system outer membrane protein
MWTRNLTWIVGIVLLGGCSNYPLRQQVDDLICTPMSVDPAPEPGKKTSLPDKLGKFDPSSDVRVTSGEAGVDSAFDALRTASFQDKKNQLRMYDRIVNKSWMDNIPGSDADVIKVEINKNAPDRTAELLRANKEVADKHFKSLAPLDPEFKPAPGPNGQQLTLADLQKMARTNSPLLRQAAANWEAAKGAAFQAGMYPNPALAFGGNTPGQSGGPIYEVTATQTIKTVNKLPLTQAAAIKDLEVARWAYRRAETDLTYAVRSNYFAVLVAQETIRVNRAVVQLTDEIYRVMVDSFRVGQNTPYEPLQMGVFAEQARTALIVSRNSYTLAWKNLATSMGLPAMPPTDVAGRITGNDGIPVPKYRHEKILPIVLSRHTDVLTALENVDKARYNLRLAEVTPIPDVNLQFGGWYDNTQGGPNRWVSMTSLGFTIPVWDQNKGAIRQARGQLLSNVEGPHAVRNALTASMADAYRRYDESMTLIDMYVHRILPRQVQSFRQTLNNHEASADAAYWDVIGAEQNLLTMVGNYLPLLGTFWQSVADVANLLQTDDIFAGEPVAEPLPDLAELLKCCHPCSTNPNPELKSFDPTWPHAGTDVTRPALLAPTPLEKKQQSNYMPSLPELPPRIEFGAPVEYPNQNQSIIPLPGVNRSEAAILPMPALPANDYVVPYGNNRSNQN